jgi:putative endonuclease
MDPRAAFAAWFRRRLPQRPLGQRGERAAARHLRRLGYHIVARGDRHGPGELDLVAVDGRTVVFVEVKTRVDALHGSPADAVDMAKQRRLTRLAESFLKRHGLLEYPARFDVVAIVWPEGSRRPASIEHFRNAFEAVGESGFHS